MQALEKELCLLIGAITGSSRVSFLRVNRNLAKVDVTATSLGEARSYNLNYDLTMLSTERPVVLAPSLKKLPELLNHPIHDIISNLHSVAAYHLNETPQFKAMLIAWNPSQNFFKNDKSLAIVERLIDMSKRVFFEKEASQVEFSNFLQESVDGGKLEEGPTTYSTEPVSKFLLDTLIVKNRILARNGVSYMAVRQWRKTIKAYQIKALQALKSEETSKCADIIAGEIAVQVEKMYGKLFTAVVPIPSGSSGRQRGFAVLIAEGVARRLNLPCHDILLQGPVAQGASHPKKSVLLKPYKLKEELSGNILIIDDVSSSGKHIELATLALKQFANYCTAVAWIAD